MVQEEKKLFYSKHAKRERETARRLLGLLEAEEVIFADCRLIWLIHRTFGEKKEEILVANKRELLVVNKSQKRSKERNFNLDAYTKKVTFWGLITGTFPKSKSNVTCGAF